MKKTFSISILSFLLLLFAGTELHAQQNSHATFNGGILKTQVISYSGFGLVVASGSDRPFYFEGQSLKIVGDAFSLQPGDHVMLTGLASTQNQGNQHAQNPPRSFRVVKINHPFENVVISH